MWSKITQKFIVFNSRGLTEEISVPGNSKFEIFTIANVRNQT